MFNQRSRNNNLLRTNSENIHWTNIIYKLLIQSAYRNQKVFHKMDLTIRLNLSGVRPSNMILSQLKKTL